MQGVCHLWISAVLSTMVMLRKSVFHVFNHIGVSSLLQLHPLCTCPDNWQEPQSPYEHEDVDQKCTAYDCYHRHFYWFWDNFFSESASVKISDLYIYTNSRNLLVQICEFFSFLFFLFFFNFQSWQTSGLPYFFTSQLSIPVRLVFNLQTGWCIENREMLMNQRGGCCLKPFSLICQRQFTWNTCAYVFVSDQK